MRTLEEIVKELCEVEISKASYEDEITDYETRLDFYLSNVKKDSYINYYLRDENVVSKEEEEAYGLSNIQDEVIKNIGLFFLLDVIS